MEDGKIVELYWQRDEAAIRETGRKYGSYLTRIAYNVLADWEDSEESVNDTYYRAWKSIPPHRPGRLSTYLGKITREIAIDCYRKKSRKKRGGTEYTLSLDELEECIPDAADAWHEVERHMLAEAIDHWLRGLAPNERTVFLARYYFMDSIAEIARGWGMSESKVKSMLFRMRRKLRKYLEEEGLAE